ncbi:MAG TPA: hypothetical protein VJN71_08985 [Nitrososphaerales archaeon]|nr:hypothetical protein [Nitrososphaerales archaeon]
MGYETEFIVHDGSEAVKAVLENASRPDLIIMDFRMAIMDGLEAENMQSRQ